MMGPGCLVWLLTFTSELWEAAGLTENTEEVHGIQTKIKEFPSQSKASEEKHMLNGVPERSSSESRVRKSKLKTAEKLAEAVSLVGLLTTAVQQDLKNCRLVLFYDDSDLHYAVVQDLLLLLLPNPRQVCYFLPAMP